jgi:proteasome lid subunit RPN8/RPN11
VRRAQELAVALRAGRIPFASFLECRRLAQAPHAEVIVFEVEVERAQHVHNDIRRIERIAVQFDPADQQVPEVLALRPDFPRVLHLNLREHEFPRSLCLFDQPLAEYKLAWTPAFLIDRIREWLALTAAGKLHQDDQPLEPLLLNPGGYLVLSPDLLDVPSSQVAPIFLRRVDGGATQLTLVAEQSVPGQMIEWIATCFRCAPRSHGPINQQPSTVLELHQLLAVAGTDLLAELRRRLKEWVAEKPDGFTPSAKLVMLISVPLTRHHDSPVESRDVWAFAIPTPVSEIGVQLGVWQKKGDGLGLLLTPDLTKTGRDLPLVVLSPVRSFTRDLASAANGLVARIASKMSLIGAGALGSQVFVNLIRTGVGEWVIIDSDLLLPHNLARHALPGTMVGFSKAKALATFANLTMKGAPIARAIVADVLNSEAEATCVAQSLFESDFIVDCSASVAVARHLALDVESRARRISFFMNPSGTDVAMLAEDCGRQTTLDALEMQYYRLLLHEPELDAHLANDADGVRYSRSCRDVTSTISQNHVAMLAAACSQALCAQIDEPTSRISISRTTSRGDFHTRHFTPSPVIRTKSDEWTLCVDAWLLERIHGFRATKLPNETGGVLIGAFDMQRRIIYVVDTIPSPPDSVEWPTLYIRGAQGLTSQIKDIEIRTHHNLRYVGEWHSHPDGCSCRPSSDDRKAFRWLKEHMDAAGLPALMMIVGDRTQQVWYLNKM